MNLGGTAVVFYTPVLYVRTGVFLFSGKSFVQVGTVPTCTVQEYILFF